MVDQKASQKLTFKEKCIGWGIVLAIPPLVPLILIFGFSSLPAFPSNGFAWWERLFWSAFRFPDPGAATLAFLAIHLLGLGLIGFGRFARSTRL